MVDFQNYKGKTKYYVLTHKNGFGDKLLVLLEHVFCFPLIVTPMRGKEFDLHDTIDNILRKPFGFWWL